MEEVQETKETVEEVKNPEAVLAELRRAQEDLKSLRAENRQLQAKVETAEANTPDEWKKRALTAETKLALNGQGIKDADRLMRYIGTDGLDFDENGAVVGLDERLTQLKKDLPEIFDAKRRVGGNADIFANDHVEAPKSSTEAQVARIFNKS